MVTINVSFPDMMKEWVESHIENGQYSNSSDYVRDLFRRDQAYHEKRELLIKALEEGEKSGVSTGTLDDIWRSVKAHHA